MRDQEDDSGIDFEQELIDDIAGFQHDPLGYALYAFPWGEPGSALESKTLLAWQIELLEDLGAGVLNIAQAIEAANEADEAQAYQDATSSGHGIGKSAIVSIIVLWAISTFEDTRGIVTAGTEAQLRTKTVPELAKWHRMCINKHWFIQTATAIYSSVPEHAKTWRIDYIPWSEHNPEAFAGLHNEGKRILVIMDEASTIPKIICDTIRGALTDAGTEIIWMMFGNPTRTGTPFHEAFGRQKHRWATRKIDSRNVEITNKAQLNGYVDDYGEGSDFVRIRVRGEFPRAGTTQFIAQDLIDVARKREAESLDSDPFMVMVDVARFGDDRSVIGGRKGRDARSVPWESYRGIDTMELASHAARYARQNNAKAIFVDGTGVGGGVVDRLRQLELPAGCMVYDVQFGSGCNHAFSENARGDKYANHIAEMSGHMRDWLEIGAIPDDDELCDELAQRQFGYNGKGEIVLERKKDMKKRGLSSPDKWDCLALGFHLPIAKPKKTAVKPIRSKKPMARRRR